MCGLILVLSLTNKFGQKRITSYEAGKLSLDSLFRIAYEGIDRLDTSACCMAYAMGRREKGEE